MTSELANLTTTQLLKIVSIKEQIATLTAKLNSIAGSEPQATAPIIEEAPKKRRMSAAGRAAISAGAKARWAKIKGTSPTSEPATKVKRKLSPAHKKKLVEALAKARKAKAEKAEAAETTATEPPKTEKSKSAKKDKRGSPATRAKMAAAAKARWARVKAEGKKRL